jgi:hypothetical protein
VPIIGWNEGFSLPPAIGRLHLVSRPSVVAVTVRTAIAASRLRKILNPLL